MVFVQFVVVLLLIVLSGCGGGGTEDVAPPALTAVPDLGLRIAAENECTPYDADQYRYPQSIELDIIELQGGLYSPYDGQCFENRSETDIEHIVARSEAHESGLCSASQETKTAFATDLLNLTLASPQLNRYEKIGYDVAEWQPEQNLCWFVQRTVDVRRKYGLTIDQREANAVDEILQSCTSIELIVPDCAL